MIKAICFDLDGVYFLNGKDNFIKALVSLGVSEDEAKRVFLKSEEMNEVYKKGQMSDDEFWGWADKEWHLNMTPAQYIDILISGYEVNQEAEQYVKEVKKHGYKTVICSNNFPARINGLQERFGFLNDFDTIALSYEVGANKPDKKLYESLIEKSGVEPKEIFYSDDYVPAVTAAKDLGINAFLYTDFDSFIKQLENLGIKV